MKDRPNSPQVFWLRFSVRVSKPGNGSPLRGRRPLLLLRFAKVLMSPIVVLSADLLTRLKGSLAKMKTKAPLLNISHLKTQTPPVRLPYAPIAEVPTFWIISNYARALGLPMRWDWLLALPLKTLHKVVSLRLALIVDSQDISPENAQPKK